MNRKKPTVISKLQERFRKMDVGRGLYTAFLMPTMLSMISTRAFAADTIWTKASAIMQDVYTQIRPGVKFCVSVFRQSQEWRWKAGRILA